MIHVAAEPLARATARIFMAAGCHEQEARTVADHLVSANLSGHDSHGVIRLREYLPWLDDGRLVANRTATIVYETPAALTVDGGLGFGQAIGEQAMRLGIAKAAAFGLAAVGIRNTGHLGRIGHWAERCAAAGLVSLHFVNTSGFGVLVAPWGSAEARLSANPLAAGFPRVGAEPVILDISTASIAEGKIKVARNAGTELPEGAVVDAKGRPTRDPAAFYGPPRGAILPFGGHKGSGLSVVIELLAGALTGGGCTDPHGEGAGALRNNMTSLLIAPGLLGAGDGWEREIHAFCARIKGAPPIRPDRPVLLPGDAERRARLERAGTGIPIDDTTRVEIETLARARGVPLDLSAAPLRIG